LRVVTKADVPIGPKLVNGAGIGTIKQMLCDRLRSSWPQLATILYNLVIPETGHLRATNTSQSVSSARVPLEEGLWKKILVRSFLDRFSHGIYELPELD